MKRVAVVGCPGAGKTVFCRELAKKNSLPVVHLDTYYLDESKPYYYARDRKAWLNKIKELVAKNKWIIDGNFGSTFKQRFARADTIIFLDYPRYLCVWRILKRRFEFRNKRRQEVPEDWQEKIDYEFLRYVWKFNRVSRPKVIDALSDIKAEAIILKNPGEAARYLKML
jgi:adenylate kinase family enzyme